MMSSSRRDKVHIPLHSSVTIGKEDARKLYLHSCIHANLERVGTLNVNGNACTPKIIQLLFAIFTTENQLKNQLNCVANVIYMNKCHYSEKKKHQFWKY